MNIFVGTKNQIKWKHRIEKPLRIIFLPITFPIFLISWLVYNMNEIIEGLDMYVYENILEFLSSKIARLFK